MFACALATKYVANVDGTIVGVQCAMYGRIGHSLSVCVRGKNMRLILVARKFNLVTLWHYLRLDSSCSELIDLRLIIPNNNK